MFNDKAGWVSLKTEQTAKPKVQGGQGSQVPRRDAKHCHPNQSLTISPMFLFLCPGPVVKPCKQTVRHPKSDSCRQIARHSQPRQHARFPHSTQGSRANLRFWSSVDQLCTTPSIPSPEIETQLHSAVGNNNPVLTVLGCT